MDIYLIRKCRVEMKEFKGEYGKMYKLPVMTREYVYSYIVKELLTPVQRDKLQNDLEAFFLRGDKNGKDGQG